MESSPYLPQLLKMEREYQAKHDASANRALLWCKELCNDGTLMMDSDQIGRQILSISCQGGPFL